MENALKRALILELHAYMWAAYVRQGKAGMKQYNIARAKSTRILINYFNNRMEAIQQIEALEKAIQDRQPVEKIYCIHTGYPNLIVEILNRLRVLHAEKSTLNHQRKITE